MYRHRPSWYQSGLTQIAARFAAVFQSRPPNLSLLPSFTSQELMPDGVFLNPVSGLHFVLHLFDNVDAALSLAQADSEAKLCHYRDDVRLHDDRLAYLEHRHVHLLNRVNHRAAVDSEFDDFVLNKSEEDWIEVRRLKRLPKMSGQDWQAAAKKQVTELIVMTLRANRVRLDFEVLLVVNPIRHVTTGPTLYNVQLDSVHSCRQIRELFSGFFRKINPIPLPQEFKEVSLRNKITLNTKIRISILHELGTMYQASNPGSSYRVSGYDSRPRLTTLPPKNSSAHPRSYNYIQAATTLRSDFSDENLVKIYSVVGANLPGELKALFIILNDDDRDRCLELVRASREQRNQSGAGRQQGGRGGGSGGGGRGGGNGGGGRGGGRGGRSSGAHVNFMPVQSTSGFVHGSGAGVEVDQALISSLRSPPPPPSVELESASKNGDKSPPRSKRDRSSSSDQNDRKRSRSSSERDDRRHKKHKKKKSKRSRHYSSSSSDSGSSASGSSRSSRGSRFKTKSKSKKKK